MIQIKEATIVQNLGDAKLHHNINIALKNQSDIILLNKITKIIHQNGGASYGSINYDLGGPCECVGKSISFFADDKCESSFDSTELKNLYSAICNEVKTREGDITEQMQKFLTAVENEYNIKNEKIESIEIY